MDIFIFLSSLFVSFIFHFHVWSLTLPMFLWLLRFPWWRHWMEAFSALLALCTGNSPVSGESQSQRPVTGSFDIFFDLRLNKRLSKQPRRWRFETPSRSSCFLYTVSDPVTTGLANGNELYKRNVFPNCRNMGPLLLTRSTLTKCEQIITSIINRGMKLLTIPKLQRLRLGNR